MNWSKYFFIIGLAVCLPLRIFLVFRGIDPATGFYDSNSFTVPLYNTLLLLCLVIMVGYGMFRMRPASFEPKNKPVLSAASLVMGAAVLLQSAMSFWRFLRLLMEWQDPLSYLTAHMLPALGRLLFLFLGLAASATFFSFAMGYSGGKPVRRTAALLMPSVWAIVYCAQQFMAYPQIADFSDRVLWLLTLLFFSLFLLGQARIIRQINPVKGVRYLTAFGFSGALCGILLGLSQLFTLQKVSTLPISQWVLAALCGAYSLIFALNTKEYD